ncbi:sensor histidine kinase [Streptomyces avermitilis]
MSGESRPSDAALRRTGFAAAGVVLVGAVLTVWWGRGLSFPAGSGEQPVPYGQLAGAMLAVPAGLVLINARPRNSIGWLLLSVPVFGMAQNAASVYAARALARPEEQLSGSSWAYSLGQSLWVPAFAQILLLLVRYPRGHLPSPRWRWVNRAVITGTLLVGAGFATAAPRPEDHFLGEGPVTELPSAWTTALLTGGGVPLGLAALVVLGGAPARIRRARPPERQQLLWLLVSVTLLLAVSFVPSWSWMFPLTLGLISCAVAVGVLWYRLLGIEVILRRTLLYGGLTLAVLCAYAGVAAVLSAAALSAVVPSRVAPEVVASAVVAALLVPVRDRLQRAVDRLVYGARSDPLRAFHRLRNEVSTDVVDVLPSVVVAVAAAVRARYAAVITADGTVLAQTGDAHASRAVRPLVIAGRHLADLVVCPAERDGFVPIDAQIIDALAAPVALIVHAERLNHELRAARERAVDAATAERTRIRNDLHDGLGPSLSGVALGLEAVQASMTGESSRMEELVRRLRIEVGRAVDDVRSIIEDLRPAVLDLHGLVFALRERAAALTESTGGRLVVTVESPDELPRLSGATETAAHRIAEEALTNVVKHADATRCVVRLGADSVLTLEVRDNGRTSPSPTASSGGVGLASMRRRTEQLGGTFQLVSDEWGHLVSVQLPLDNLM